MSFEDYMRTGVEHPNPLFDYLTTFVSRDLKSLFKQVEYLYYNSPQIFAAMNKLAGYPITDFVYNTDSEKLKGKYQNLAVKSLKLKNQLVITGIDRHLYGNSFLSIYFPFKRFLGCTHCRKTVNIRHTKFKFEIKQKACVFSFDCPACGKFVRKAEIHDEKLRDPRSINLVRWDPKQIDIEYNPITGESEYYYHIPEYIAKKVQDGSPHVVSTMPVAFLETIAQEKVFKFAAGKLYHMKAEAPAGVDNRFGLPPLASTIKMFLYTAVLKKANESIALEHIVPFRVLHPAQASATGDPTTSISLNNWMTQLKSNLKQWRQDPLHMMFAPIPVGMTQIGGQGRALMVTGEITESENAIIAAMGIPREFIYGGLSATGSSVTLRMLENQLLNYTTQLVDQAQWVLDRCAEFLGWKKIKIELEPFKLVDDVQQKTFVLQANQAANGTLISNKSVGALFGLDIEKERVLRKQETLDEQRFQYEVQQAVAKMQENLAQRAQASATANQPQGYDQQAVIGQADQIVQQISSMDEGSRKSFLHSLQMEDMVMYSVVIQRWEEMKTQNEAQMRAQAAGQGAPQ